MNEQTHKDSEVCERLLVNRDFIQYQDMMERWLKTETSLYLDYCNTKVTPAREDAEKREFKGGLSMLKRIIRKPEIMNNYLKKYREASTKSSKVAK